MSNLTITDNINETTTTIDSLDLEDTLNSMFDRTEIAWIDSSIGHEGTKHNIGEAIDDLVDKINSGDYYDDETALLNITVKKVKED